MGLNGWTERGHDGGASIIVDGKLVCALEEEKIISKRHAYDKLPSNSICECLKQAHLTLDDIDKFCFGWDYEKIYEMIGKKFLSKEEVCLKMFGSSKYADKFQYVDHHLAHAYSAFVPSNYDTSLVFVIDGQGEYMGTSVYLGSKNKKLKLLYQTPVSLGYFYTAITKQIGFKNGEEGKTMGLASYGKPIYIDLLRKMINADEKGNLHCIFDIEKVDKDEENLSLIKWEKLLNQILPKRSGKIVKFDDEILQYANLAKSAQKLLEEILVKLVKYYAEKYNNNNVCLAGGVSLNCPAVSCVEQLNLIDSVFVQPAANDSGISLGAAIKGAIDLGEKVCIEMIPYLGLEYSQEEIEKVLKSKNYEYTIHDNIAKTIAQLLKENKIVANFQGKLEFGPRALGNRSLLANPENYNMLLRMNELKGRESWRPLAPAIMYDFQSKYFDSNIFSPYMTKNFKVLTSMKTKLGAVTHVDGTARVQSVTKKYNKLFYEIIYEFYKLTNIPVVINTSFNVKGEPIVCTPEQAIDSFERMNLDYMAIGNYLIKGKHT